jgi:hypothetical protein
LSEYDRFGEKSDYGKMSLHYKKDEFTLLLSGDEKKVIESMSPSLSLSNFFDSENIG